MSASKSWRKRLLRPGRLVVWPVVWALMSGSVGTAQVVELSERTHRERFPSRDEVKKEFHWTTRGTIRHNPAGTRIEIDHRGERLVDEFTSVAGEIEFANAEDSLVSVEVRLADGTLRKSHSNQLELGSHQVFHVLTVHECVGRQWTHRWSVREPTQTIDRSIERAADMVADARDRPAPVKLVTSQRVGSLLSLHDEEDPEVAATGTAIDLARERRELLRESLQPYFDEIRRATNDSERRQALLRLQDAMLFRSAHLARLMVVDGVQLEDTRRLTNLAKYATQAADDVRDASFESWATGGGDASGLQTFLNVTYGVTAMAEGAEDGDARRMASGLRNTIGQVRVAVPRPLGVPGLPNAAPHPISAILDLPTETTAAVLDVTREGTEKVTQTMGHISDAIEGDDDAVERAIEGSGQVQQVLSQENYGSAMLDAMKDRLLDRVPFVRTVQSWFG